MLNVLCSLLVNYPMYIFVAIDCTVQSLTANNFKLLDSHLDILLSVLTNDVENIIRFHIIRSVTWPFGPRGSFAAFTKDRCVRWMEAIWK